MLEILGPAPSKNGARVRVRCVCGEEFVAYRRQVVSGNTRSCGCLTVDLRRDLKLATPFIPAQSVHVFDPNLLGRAVIALAAGPLTLPALAQACCVTEAELVERQGVLRGHVHALRFGDDVAYLHSHGLTTGWDELEPMRGGVMSDERKAA